MFLQALLLTGFLMSSSVYYPAAGDAWEKREPEALGMDPALLAEAIAFAQVHETSMPGDPGQYLRDRFAGLEHQEIVGPTIERGGVNGLVIRNGYIVAEWGDTRRVDMTFSVTKSSAHLKRASSHSAPPPRAPSPSSPTTTSSSSHVGWTAKRLTN